LLAICDVLELDEVVYSIYLKESTHGGLREDDEEEIVRAVDNSILMYWIAIKLVNPATPRILRRFYPYPRHLLNLALSIGDDTLN
jgi:hypothetical protein